ncbi:MAG TPA: DUF4388 domain-containing protein, partial [Candidatus Obscuribacterales bacterium]
MNRQSPEQENRSVKVNQLSRLPELEDVHKLLEKAGDLRGTAVELGWILEEKRQQYKLSVICELEGGEPRWELYSGLATANRLLWSHVTGDATLIQNFLVHECTGGELQEGRGQVFAYLTQPPPLDEPSLRSAASATAPRASHDNHKATHEDRTAARSVESTGGSSAPEGRVPEFAKVNVPPIAADLLPHKPSLSAAQRAEATLVGEISDIVVGGVMQTISLSALTGRLHLESARGTAAVFFDKGIAVHAVAPGLTGDAAVVEVCTWTEGNFLFNRDELTQEKSVKRDLRALFVEGILLKDQNEALRRASLSLNACLARTNPSISEKQFEEAVSNLAAVDLTLQKRFYQSIDGRCSILDMAMRLGIQRPQLIPIMHNLLSAELAVRKEPPKTADPVISLEAVGIDASGIDNVARQLCKQDTGILGYHAFLYVLEQEFYRHLSQATALSVIIFEIVLRGETVAALPANIAKEALQAISLCKRKMDVLAHFESFEYALLLPLTRVDSAITLVQHLIEVLNSGPFAQRIGYHNIGLSFGIAGMPEDTKELGLLLAGARRAKNRAKESISPVVLLR